MDPKELKDICQKLENQTRISASEALLLFQNAPWLDLVRLAGLRRDKIVGPGTASYAVFAIINYTNICDIGCTFCSYKRDKNNKSAYVLSKDDIFKKIDFALTQQADQIFFQGGVHADLNLNYYTDIISAIKERYHIHIRGFSPVELKHIAIQNGMAPTDVIYELKAAGLNSVPGAGAEILSDRVRQILSPKKCTTQEWQDIMKLCHREGLTGSANIVVGSVETDIEIINHLNIIRSIQDETGGFNSFIAWTFQQQTKDFITRNIPTYQYLKLVALSRLFLDNIKNIEVSVLVLGKDVGGLALHMGANDISSPVIEENVLRSYGIKNEREAVLFIQNAGFQAVRRDFSYNIVKRWES